MSKYHSRRTVIDGIAFDSAAEARRYGELMLMQRAGEIHDLELQPEFKIVINGKLICKYRADFQYQRDGDYGYFVTEDVKSLPTRTPVYRLKKKLVEALYGITIVEIDA